MKIVMVRHGRSVANMERILSGSNETPLSDKGKLELLVLRKKLNYPKTDIYISSPLSRCVDTFNILYPNKTLNRTDERFKEISFAEYEGSSLDRKFLDEFFIDFFNDIKIKDGETHTEFLDRLEDGLKSLYLELKENKLTSATILAHSTVIKVLVKKGKNISNDEYKNIPIKNGRGYIFDIDLVENKIVYNSVKTL